MSKARLQEDQVAGKVERANGGSQNIASGTPGTLRLALRVAGPRHGPCRRPAPAVDTGVYLRAHAGGKTWDPVVLPVKGPTPDELLHRFEDVRKWVAAFESGL